MNYYGWRTDFADFVLRTLINLFQHISSGSRTGSIKKPWNLGAIKQTSTPVSTSLTILAECTTEGNNRSKMSAGIDYLLAFVLLSQMFVLINKTSINETTALAALGQWIPASDSDEDSRPCTSTWYAAGCCHCLTAPSDVRRKCSRTTTKGKGTEVGVGQVREVVDESNNQWLWPTRPVFA